MSAVSELVFTVSALLQSDPNKAEEHKIDCVLPFSKNELEAEITSPLQGEISLQKIERDIVVKLKQLTVKVQLECDRCMIEFKKELIIKNKEYLFFYKPAPASADLDELNKIDLRTLTIDLTPIVRQEIVLNLPLHTLCNEKCLGLCPKCRQNLNQKKCSCLKDDLTPPPNQPLKNLKSLFLLAQKQKLK